MSQSTITLEELAVKLDGKLWIKGDMKRIYLDRGYNTKKMSTKTFVFQQEDGRFGVSCYIDCPSQAHQWIKSQQQEVIDSVMEDIDEATSETAYIIVNDENRIVNWKGEVVDLDDAQGFYVESSAKSAIGDYAANKNYITMPRAEYDAEVARLIEEGRPERERLEAEAKAKRAEEAAQKEAAILEQSKKLQDSGEIASVNARVKHAKFGEGTVVYSDLNMVEVMFDNTEHGLKKMVRKFVKLEILSND